ncbi:MAG TPA: amidohydrolase family protein [Candidatus Limnocylindrales bacterium]|nr:amidohydrolase family protein [Candidatus Limnocylindrales bacterium]
MFTSLLEIPIIDFHTHLGNIFPMKTRVDLEAETGSPPSLMITSPDMINPRELFYRNRLQPFSFNYLKHGLRVLYWKRKMIQGATIPNLQKSMKKYGIYQSVALPIEYTSEKEETSVLELIRVCGKYREIIPFCSVDPRDPKAKDRLKYYLIQGARGLKLHPNLQRFKPSDPICLEICEEASRYSLPIIFHTGTKGTESHPEQIPSNLENFESIFPMFPQTTFILGHMGISQYRQAIRLAQRYQNIYLETSGQPTAHIRQAIESVGGDKILFGSDWPLWDPIHPLKAVWDATGKDLALRKRILYENAREILKI